METESTCSGRGLFEINVEREKGENHYKAAKAITRILSLQRKLGRMCYRESNRNITVIRFY